MAARRGHASDIGARQGLGGGPHSARAQARPVGQRPDRPLERQRHVGLQVGHRAGGAARRPWADTLPQREPVRSTAAELAGEAAGGEAPLLRDAAHSLPFLAGARRPRRREMEEVARLTAQTPRTG